MKSKILPWVIAFAALSISASAAFYSVTGLSKLFAGASFAVILMTSSLEFSKLVIASLLYQYWSSLNKILRTYLSIACVVLILITSIGIYGFLSAAYQQTATLEGSISSQIELLERKKTNYEEQLAVYVDEKTSISASVTALRGGLSNNVVQYTNAEGQVITTTSSSTRRALEKQLDQAIERQTIINGKVDNLNQQIFDLDSEIVEVQTSSEITSELGPLKYVSGLLGVRMDKVVNYLLLIIVFVFDPLAISLVLAANFAFEQARPKFKKIEINPSIKK